MAAQSTTLTDVEKINKIPWMIAGDAMNVGFFLFSLSGPAFLLFLDELGLDTVQIGLMLSLVPFFGMLSPFVGPWVARFGYKRTFITFRTLRVMSITFILLTPWIARQFGEGATFYYVALVIAAFAMCRGISETGSFPWYKSVIPDSIRGKFGAMSGMVSTSVSILVAIISGYIIDSGTSGLGRYILLFALAVTLGYLSIVMYSRVPAEPRTEKRDEPQDSTRSTFGEVLSPLSDRQFVQFAVGVGFVSIGGISIISFIPLFMEQEVGLSEGRVVLLAVGTHLGALITSYLWGWTADRYGSKPIMQTGIAVMLTLPFLWLAIPQGSIWSFPIAIFIAFVTGIATLAWQIGWTRFIYNNTPDAEKTTYMALFFAWWGFSSGIGPLVAGQILKFSEPITGQFLFLQLTPYTPLFLFSLCMVFVGFFIISRLAPGDDTSFARFTGMFLRGNMFRGLESLIQYNFAGNEDHLIKTTERMGIARSPFSHNELIEALSDPSFNVRYQAINAIGRMEPEAELVEALLSMLDDEPSELSFAVTRSLGRLGDKRAIEPLRSYLASGYRLLEANSARALAMLDDRDSAALIHFKLVEEHDPVLRVAYATALGKLQLTKSIPTLFALLRELHTDVQRGEVGLALARMLGDERYYLQHWRPLRADPSTAAAQAALGLQRLTQDSAFRTMAENCAGAFAEREPKIGAAYLIDMVDTLPAGIIDPTVIEILKSCQQLLREFGYKRLTYILLTLHTLDFSLRQKSASKLVK